MFGQSCFFAFLLLYFKATFDNMAFHRKYFFIVNLFNLRGPSLRKWTKYSPLHYFIKKLWGKKWEHFESKYANEIKGTIDSRLFQGVISRIKIVICFEMFENLLWIELSISYKNI